MKTLASRVKYARERKGFSQYETAKKVGITASAYSRIELGLVKEPGKLVVIAKVLGVTAEWLYFGGIETSTKKSSKNIKEIEDFEDCELFASYVPIFDWEEINKIDSIKEIKSHKRIGWAPLLGNGGIYTFVAKMDGLSMFSAENPHCSVRPNEIIYFDPEIKLYNGCLVVAKIKDENTAIFRQYLFECGKNYLTPLNKQYSAIPVDNNVNILAVSYCRFIESKAPEIALHHYKKG